ncbi:MAG: hypothetical protein AAF986_11475 [Pseudomonadota bacterium]
MAAMRILPAAACLKSDSKHVRSKLPAKYHVMEGVLTKQLKRLAFVSTVALGLLTQQAVSQTQGDLGPQGVSDAVAATVQNVISTQTKALATGDIDTYASFWAQDGMLMPMRKSRIGGRDNIVKFVEANFKANTNVTY